MTAQVLVILGFALRDRDPTRAITIFDEAADVAAARRVPPEVGSVLTFVADALVAAGRYEPAAMLQGAVTTHAPFMAASPHVGIAAARTRIETAVGDDQYQTWHARHGALTLDDAMELAQLAVNQLGAAAAEAPD